MENKKALTKWLYWFLFAVAVIAVYKTLDNFTDIINFIKGVCGVIMPFLIGIFIAYLLYIPCRKIENLFSKNKLKRLRKKARLISVILVYITVILIIIIAMNFIIPYLVSSVSDLASNATSYYNIAIDAMENIPEESFLRNIDIEGIVEGLKGIKLEQYFNIEAITKYVKEVIGVVNGIFDVFVSIVVSIYILIERTQIINFIRKIAKVSLKESTYKTFSKYFYSSNEIFFKFLSSQIIDAVIVGILTSIAMSILGVKYAVLLGVMIGISNLIPYFGAIVGVGLSIIITIFTGGISKAIWLAIVVIILQQIDANIINPKIVGNSLKISPLLVIFAVTVGGAYFGVLGMFLAVPIFTVIKKYIVDYVDYKNKLKQT